MILENQWQTTKVFYLFLYSSFGQCVAVAQIIDFNVLDEVSILLVDVARDSLAGASRRRLDDWRSNDLGALSAGPKPSGANVSLTERIGGTSTC
jgi:hypothetical protein